MNHYVVKWLISIFTLILIHFNNGEEFYNAGG